MRRPATRCPVCRGIDPIRGRCTPCRGTGNFRLDPVTVNTLPMVERMEIDHLYVNCQNVYLHPLAVVETSMGPHVVFERFYRPSCREWIERALPKRYGSRSPTLKLLDKSWSGPGRPWHDTPTLPQHHRRCDRSNPTWEIDWEDWQRALDDPEIWMRPPAE